MPSCGRTIRHERRSLGRRRFPGIGPGVVVLASLLLIGGAAAQGQDASLYKEALTRESALREDMAAVAATDPPEPLYERIRVMVGAFEDIDRLFSESDYGDDALWHGGVLAADLFDLSGNPADRMTAVRLFEKLADRFPDSQLTEKAAPVIARLQAPPDDGPGSARSPAPPAQVSSPPPATTPAPQAVPRQEQAPAAPAPEPAPAPPVPASTAKQGAGTAAAPAATPAPRAAVSAPPPAAPPPPAPRSTARPPAAPPAAPPATAPPRAATPRAPAPPPAATRSAASPPRAPAPRPAAMLRAVEHILLPEVVRVTLTLEREVAFTHTRITNPPRLVVDLQNVIPDAPVREAIVTLGDPMIRRLHVIGPSGGRTRVAIDLGGAVSYSVYALYNPFRLVIDFERRGRAGAAAPGATPHAAAAALAAAAPPRPAAANTRGGFSMSRQLGLAASRIVIDPGHGGHDPGTDVAGLTESALVLDVALRLERLLKEGDHADVILTRRDDTYVALEERTDLANRADADLFLSIHANAHAAAGVRGVETYVLSFATTPETEALAARENAASSRSMRDLPDLVRAIATDNKRDESRDFARLVQAALYDRLRTVNKGLKNLGVKQAPFMVLVGARMPAILAEVAFMTNRQEAALLRTPKYRQQIAEALLAGITRYQDTLKKTTLAAGG